MSVFTEANRKAFDDLASSYDSKPWQITLSNQVASALRARKAQLGLKATAEPAHVRLLDYASGTGAVTRALGESVSCVRAIDISANMVARYNAAAREASVSEEQAFAVEGDLFAAEVAEALTAPEWYNFDVAVVALGFHHFEDPALAVKRLAERLVAATGVLAVVDFLPFEHEPGAQMQETIRQHGFTSAGLERVFKAGGLEDFKFEVLEEPAVLEDREGRRKERRVFVASGRKAPTVWGKLAGWVGGLQDGIGGQMAMRPDQCGGGMFMPRKDAS